MTVLSALNNQFGSMVTLENFRPNVQRIYAPFFHEDGDMISMYVEDTGNGTFRLRDYGNTLMRVSYTFDLDTDNKRNVLNEIVKSNNGIMNDGELIIDCNMENIVSSVFRYSQLVAKVSNINILRNEIIKSLFYENLNTFVHDNFKKYGVRERYIPTSEKELVVDYYLPSENNKPIYLFGVNKDNKASKVVISCLNFQKKHIPFRSLIVHENFNELSAFNRSQITNAADKQFVTLNDFISEGVDYIERELVS